MAIVSIASSDAGWKVLTQFIPIGEAEPETQEFQSGNVITDWFNAVSYITSAYLARRIADLRTTFVTTEFDRSKDYHRFSKCYIIPTEISWSLVDHRPVSGIFFPVYIPRQLDWTYRDIVRYSTDHNRKVARHETLLNQ